MITFRRLSYARMPSPTSSAAPPTTTQIQGKRGPVNGSDWPGVGAGVALADVDAETETELLADALVEALADTLTDGLADLETDGHGLG